jgi:membrane-associated phospholipid phosphatase
MTHDDPASSRRAELNSAPIGALRRVVVLAVISLVAGSSWCEAQEYSKRMYGTAPTAYRRPASRILTAPSALFDTYRSNAEADIPQSHLLYSLHAPPQDSVILQAGGTLEPAPLQAFGVETAGGQLGTFSTRDASPCSCGPNCRREPPFEDDFSMDRTGIEHIRPSPSWTSELSLSSDLAHSWARLRQDTCGVLHPNNILILALAGGGAAGLRENADERVRSYTARHEGRWGDTSKILGEVGYINVQIPALLGTYFWSLHTQNEELHDVSKTMISAFTINGASNLIIKAAANTSRPSDDFNGGQYGFPSYHAASSFTVASVLDEYYGHRVGIPAYTFAGLIAWSRIDERDHDLSDVVFGSVMGFVIGKSVAQHHLTGDSRVQILPWLEPIGGTTGLQLSMVW